MNVGVRDSTYVLDGLRHALNMLQRIHGRSFFQVELETILPLLLAIRGERFPNCLGQ